MKTILITITTALMLGTTAMAQNSVSLQLAFANSYDQEYNGNYSEAIALLKKVYNANSYELNLRLGWLYYNNGDYQEALNYYQKAIGIQPTSVEARLGYVLPAAALENWSQVITKYEEILTIDPQNTTANYRLGYLYYYQENFSRSVKYLEKVERMYPFDFDTVILLAWTKLKLGKNTEAEALFSRALMISPENNSAKEGLDLLN